MKTHGELQAELDELRRTVARMAKQDRSAMLRMAGNIACGMTNWNDPELVAKRACSIARAIIAEVDKP